MGRGSLERRIRSVIYREGLHDRIKLGFSPNPVTELRHSLIFASLQQRENYPSQALLEAMACANAIIATDVGMTKNLVNEEIGILISGKKGSLKNAVSNLLNTPSKAIEMGCKARAKVLREHSVNRYWDYFVSSFIE